MATPSASDLDDFLKKVDEIESTVKGIQTGDKEAIEKADKLLKAQKSVANQKGFDRTVINKDAYKKDQLKDSPTDGTSDGSIDQESFMKFIEADANDRARQRKERARSATVHKEAGNQAFKLGNWEEAIENYTRGTEAMKDMTVLYTNRAQAHIKLEHYDEAISDCDFALRIEEDFTKAFINKGRALLGKKDYDAAIQTYEEILTFHPEQDKLVEDYKNRALQAKAVAAKEEKAKQLLEAGDMKTTSVREVIEKLQKSDQPLIYYQGGARIMLSLLKDDTETSSCTMFRMHNGFNLITENPTISCYFVASPDLTGDQALLVSLFLDIFTEACKDNEENQRSVMNLQGFAELIVGWLADCSHSVIRDGCILLLLLLSQTQAGLKLIIDTLDVTSLLLGLISHMQRPKSQTLNAAKLMNNLVSHDRVAVQFRRDLEEKTLPAFINLLQKSNKVKKEVLTVCLSTLGNLAKDVIVRKTTSNQKEFWDACHHLLLSFGKESRDLEVTYALLGLMMNVSLEVSNPLRNASSAITQGLLPFLDSEDGDIVERVCGVLSKIGCCSESAIDVACTARIPSKLIHILKNAQFENNTCKYVVKCLAVFTKRELAAQQVANADKGLGVLLGVLEQAEEEAVVANAGLCLGHCAAGVEGVSTQLLQTDVIRLLLAKTHTTSAAIKENCAIATAKIVQGDARHMERLRELHGMEILHGLAKHVKF